MAINDTYTEPITGRNVETVDDAARAFFTASPAWVAALMRLRNRLVARLGFETGEAAETLELPDRFETGNSIGLFEVQDRTDDTIRFGADDKHFAFHVDVVVPEDAATVTVTTTSTAHDRMGEAYLKLVGPFHRRIAPVITRRIATS